MKTIKQIADELGIDKQKVYRFVKKNCINEVHHDVLQNHIKTTSVKQYDEVAEMLIIEHFKKEIKSKSHQNCINEVHHDVLQNHIKTTSVKQYNEELFELLKQELELKNKQLEKKDNQIESLNNRLEEMSNLLNQQQLLHASSEKKILELEEPKKRWWQR